MHIYSYIAFKFVVDHGLSPVVKDNEQCKFLITCPKTTQIIILLKSYWIKVP